MMDITVIQNKLKDINFYKDKKFVKFFKKLSEEEVNTFIDSTIIEFVSGLDINKIGLIFRNSNAAMQDKLFENEKIQKILIIGENDEDNIVCDEKLLRNLENLSKVIKADATREKIYHSKYFIDIIFEGKYFYFENRFFNDYDIKKMFDAVIMSERYNSQFSSEQQRVVEKINDYSADILLPRDFRSKFSNIDKILQGSTLRNYESEILDLLKDDELFYLEFKSKDKTKNRTLKKYLYQKLKVEDQSTEEFFRDVDNKEKQLVNRYGYRNFLYRSDCFSLQEKMYYILLEENQDEIVKEKFLKYLICKVMVGSSLDAEMIYNTLKRNLNNHLLGYDAVKNLTSDRNIENKDLRLAFYQKFNIALNDARYLTGISVDQLIKVNVKHINKLAKFLEDKTQDELSAIYGTCIKLYFIFGYERSLEILSGKYGDYNKLFLDNVSKCCVKDIKMRQEGSKYLPEIDKRFITFMFATPKKNHFIDMMNNKSSALYKNWYYFYNNYDEILEKCHGEITLKKVNLILETDNCKVSRKLITPDCYRLNNNDFLENIVLGNKVNRSDDEILENIVSIYSKMKKRVESSIPYVAGEATNKYRYEVMKFDDPQIFELGYKADCCIRVCDIAHNHLLHAALCRNGRILLIYDRLGDLAAFSPLKRNGNVLIANSIECVDKNYEVTGNFIAEAFKEAMLDIVSASKESDEPINLACIGRKAYVKPNVVPFPDGYLTPTIFEKTDDIYKKTDCYHKNLDIVYVDTDFKFENIKSRDPEVSYMDPRDEVKYVDVNDRMGNLNAFDEAAAVINSVNYTLSKDDYSPVERYLLNAIYYNKDWYIADTYRGIISGCLDTDYRAREEFNEYMKRVNGDSSKVFKK